MTKLEKQVYEAGRERQKANPKMAPSILELAADTQRSVGSVWTALKGLQKKGWVTKAEKVNRSYEFHYRQVEIQEARTA